VVRLIIKWLLSVLKSICVRKLILFSKTSEMGKIKRMRNDKDKQSRTMHRFK
jgi:hypothetical protein